MTTTNMPLTPRETANPDGPALTPREQRDRAAAQVTEMATRIRITDQRNYLHFRTLFQAEQAAETLRAAGLPVRFLGGNQPVLTTTSDRFAEKGGE